MANIAQTVNVLQAMILTDGAQMLLTPTYHVCEMWKAHQDAQLLPHFLRSADYSHGDVAMPALNVSASAREGKITVTIAHCDANNSAEIAIELRGAGAHTVTGRVLCAGAINAYNTFDSPELVAPRDLRDDELRREGERLVLQMPAASVATLCFSE